MTKYKAHIQGINVILQEESYTSKASFFDNDELPNYKQKCKTKIYTFNGKRIYRGLYETKSGMLINADVNGSLNILRKYLKCTCDEIISPANIGFVVNPVKISL